MSVRIVNRVPSVSKSLQISDQERMARFLLEKDYEKYREAISEKLEIVSIDTEISNQNTFLHCLIPQICPKSDTRKNVVPPRPIGLQ